MLSSAANYDARQQRHTQRLLVALKLLQRKFMITQLCICEYRGKQGCWRGGRDASLSEETGTVADSRFCSRVKSCLLLSPQLPSQHIHVNVKSIQLHVWPRTGDAS